MSKSKKWSMWRDPNVYIGIGIAVIVIPALIYAIVTHVRRPDEPGDFLYEDIAGERTKLTLAAAPAKDGSVWDVIADDSVDMRILELAINRWHQKTQKRVFSHRQSQEFFDHPMYLLAGDPTVKQAANYRFGTVGVRVFTEGGGESCGGITHHSYDLKTGRVWWADISINPMYTHDEKSYEAALVHELGHALLLGHHDHRSSIMRKKLNIRGTITDHHSKLVKGLWISEQPR